MHVPRHLAEYIEAMLRIARLDIVDEVPTLDDEHPQLDRTLGWGAVVHRDHKPANPREQRPTGRRPHARGWGRR